MELGKYNTDERLNRGNGAGSSFFGASERDPIVLNSNYGSSAYNNRNKGRSGNQANNSFAFNDSQAVSPYRVVYSTPAAPIDNWSKSRFYLKVAVGFLIFMGLLVLVMFLFRASFHWVTRSSDNDVIIPKNIGCNALEKPPCKDYLYPHGFQEQSLVLVDDIHKINFLFRSNIISRMSDGVIDMPMIRIALEHASKGAIVPSEDLSMIVVSLQLATKDGDNENVSEICEVSNEVCQFSKNRSVEFHYWPLHITRELENPFSLSNNERIDKANVFNEWNLDSKTQALKKMLQSGKGASVIIFHCHYGKDRTGVVAAAYKMRFLNSKLADVDKENRAIGNIQDQYSILTMWYCLHLKYALGIDPECYDVLSAQIRESSSESKNPEKTSTVLPARTGRSTTSPVPSKGTTESITSPVPSTGTTESTTSPPVPSTGTTESTTSPPVPSAGTTESTTSPPVPSTWTPVSTIPPVASTRTPESTIFPMVSGGTAWVSQPAMVETKTKTKTGHSKVSIGFPRPSMMPQPSTSSKIAEVRDISDSSVQSLNG